MLPLFQQDVTSSLLWDGKLGTTAYFPFCHGYNNLLKNNLSHPNLFFSEREVSRYLTNELAVVLNHFHLRK
jgi:hypothetical protein